MLLFAQKLVVIIRCLVWLHCCRRNVSQCCAVSERPGEWRYCVGQPCRCLSGLSESWEDHFIIVCLPCLMLLSRREPLGKWGQAAVFAVCSFFFTGLALSELLLQPVKLLGKVCDTAYKNPQPGLMWYYSIWWLIKNSEAVKQRLDGVELWLHLHTITKYHHAALVCIVSTGSLHIYCTVKNFIIPARLSFSPRDFYLIQKKFVYVFPTDV